LLDSKQENVPIFVGQKFRHVSMLPGQQIRQFEGQINTDSTDVISVI